jgi:cytoskeletal protein CcmA (bactofilin family)
MFKNENEDGYNSDSSAVDDTVIGSSIKIEGDLVSNGSITVEGEVVGTLKTEKTLKIGEKAKVVADVKAQEAFVSGQIQGNVLVTDRLELSSTAEINGDIQASTLIIAAGAVFNGKSTMSENGQASVLAPEQKEEEVTVEDDE